MIIYNFNNVYGNFLLNRDIKLTLSNNVEISLSHSLYHYLTTSKQRIDNNVEEWDFFKKITNPYEFIHTPPQNCMRAVADYSAISRSFYKLIEIVMNYELFEKYTEPIQSFHLAEGPGGFIEAMVYMRNNRSDLHYGMTLISDKRNIPKWNKIRSKLKFNPSLRFEHGATNTGDLLHPDNFEKCAMQYKNSMDFMTGDGGFDFSIDYEKQEVASTKLIYAQIIYAIMMQKKGGSFVLKIFDIFYNSTVQLLYLLNIFYANVSICKPKTSRFANSEKYVICQDFKYSDTSQYYTPFYTILDELHKNPDRCISSIFAFHIPLAFVREVEELNCIFGKKQLNTIHNTLMMIQEQRSDKIERLRKSNIEKCVQWCLKNNLPCHNQFKPQNIFTKQVIKNNNTSNVIKLNKL
jgi:23S rRNA U2552 (ribose-2'-O)-methylase RlmE/FtsJ